MARSRMQADITVAQIAAIIGGYAVTARRLWLRIGFERSNGLPMLRRCLVDTGAPLSVIPHSIHHTHGFVWQQVNDPAIAPGVTSWNAVPADLGVISVWIPVRPGRVAGPFDMVAKFPQRVAAAELKGRDRPPVLVGLDFLATVAKSLEIAWQARPPRGAIVLL
jgi:hypothetical protein